MRMDGNQGLFLLLWLCEADDIHLDSPAVLARVLYGRDIGQNLFQKTEPRRYLRGRHISPALGMFNEGIENATLLYFTPMVVRHLKTR